jgi:diaminohydroxyphosphoribosylaminopyrimidine deaminase/5-amino-6-(5-phosphoribosylamino)uracil reductase
MESTQKKTVISPERWMERCFQLARLGTGSVAPNPMVGAVLVHQERVIGEGWHQQFGHAHAEVNCLRSVQPADLHLIPESTLYCSLEPCHHVGKTPPCVDLILQHRIPKVVISNTDPNPLVAGKSIQKLRDAGVQVIEDVLKKEGQHLNRIFFTWIQEKRPYIILKWAQSADGFLGLRQQRTAISGPLTQRLVHRWRTENGAVCVGSQTALVDNPQLDARFYVGKTPLRIAFDGKQRIPTTHALLNDQQKTWIIGPERPGKWENTRFLPISFTHNLPALCQLLVQENISSLLVEGGQQLLTSFIQAQLWDEIRVIENKKIIGEGIQAPVVPEGIRENVQYILGNDLIRIFYK